MSVWSSITASSSADDVTRHSLPTTVSRMTELGPISQFSPMDVWPKSIVFGRITVSIPMATSASMYTDAGSVIVTPSSIHRSRMRWRITSSTIAN